MTGGVLTYGDGPDGAPTVRVGPTITGFIEEVVRPEAREAVKASAIHVLESSLRSGQGSTGLVVGRVQSGKTLSYEGVISLARDNDFAVVVVISGISNPLLAQGEGRLKRDLTRADPDGWIFLSPAADQQAPDYVASELARVRDNWSRASTPRAWKQTAVVVVLKNYNRIRDLADTLQRVGLSDQRVLVVDDEADQASLNTLGRRGRESSTYANLRALRDALPHHYYLQYTATPQAPLLIAIQDALSPDFVRVLEPGSGYTGGELYFGDFSHLVETISTADLQAVDTPGGPPPDGLRRAMQEFLVGAAHVVASGGRPETRSMLVHPSRETGAQGVFAKWIRRMKENWQDKYEHADEVRPSNLIGEFRDAWERLHVTHPALAEFDACWNALGLVFRNLDITEVNTRVGQTPVINWTPTKSYILIGGQAIDRGFTVEGLTVTYMPRGAGTFTADTIQQRARFFGYKSSYLGLCRVYLEPDVRDAFVMYVNHEREMLKNLREIESGSDSLKDWKRRFLLDSRMRPTRASVIDIPTIRVSTSNRWVTDRHPVRNDAIPLRECGPRAEKLLGQVRWSQDSTGLHEIGWTSLRVALELLELVMPESLVGEPNHEALAVQLARLADDDTSGTAVAIYRMRPTSALAVRTEEVGGGVEIFAGRGGSNSSYPGDRQVFEASATVTIQLHRVEIQDRSTGTVRGQFLVSAWRVPESSSTGWIIELGG